MTPEQVLELANANRVEFVDLRCLDFHGSGHHLTVPVAELTRQVFVEGLRFAGTAFGGEPRAGESDVLLVPASETAFVDPFCQHTTLAMICDVHDARTREPYALDPRAVARRAAGHLAASGVADAAHFAVELEFFIFDQVCFDQGTNYAHYKLDSREGIWRRGRDEPDNLGHQVRPHEGRAPLPPTDSMHNLRSEMAAALRECGAEITGHRHAPATGGQAAIALAPDTLVRMADKVVTAKYVIRNVAARHGKVVTFMPQPLFGEHGSGLPTRFWLSQGGRPVLAGEKPGGLSDHGLWAVGGLLKHAASLLALCCSTTNSYKRLAAGADAPVRPMYSTRYRPAFVGVPTDQPQRGVKSIELWWPDASGNPYLANSAILMAALDGIQQRCDPGPPVDEDGGRMPPDRAAALGCAPGSLEEALGALREDREYLARGGVFTDDAIARWAERKMTSEIMPLRGRPHPYEFCLYFDR